MGYIRILYYYYVNIDKIFAFAGVWNNVEKSVEYRT